MIEIEQLTKKYKNLKALDAVSVSFQAGQGVAVIGPNGSGKTTLIKNILGMVLPDSGTILFEGKNIHKQHEYRKRIGYMPQQVSFPMNITVKQLLMMLKDIRREKNTDEELLELFHISEIENKNLGALSGGMKQKVNACIAFLFNPQAYILDEPTAGLDPLSAEILKNKILKEKAKGKMILVSSHILADLEELATNVLYLLNGKIFFYKTLQEILKETSAQNLSKALAAVIMKNNT
ncbi:MAG: ABC transporter ATP-binding protein [Chitinophagales bacterium]